VGGVVSYSVTLLHHAVATVASVSDIQGVKGKGGGTNELVAYILGAGRNVCLKETIKRGTAKIWQLEQAHSTPSISSIVKSTRPRRA